MAANTISSGVLVECKVCQYYRDPQSGKLHRGMRGKPGTANYQPSSGPFKISGVVWARQTALPEAQRIFRKVGDGE